ncbi:MAG TPA: FAD-dependent oxidoreductase, partial [Candidatus Paceibacterota bacterium]|nr:FAD-dependent oxidoreductase [Candidatus Paceibacterota bacterium]
YAGRKQLKTVVIAEEIGGQSAVSETIYNWIGTKAISGTDLAKNLRSHIEEYTGEKGTLTLLIGKRANKVTKIDTGFSIELADGTMLSAKTVLVSTGSRHRKLEVPGAKEFDNKGIMYCATCDGPLFTDMPVAVIGGGNAALEAAAQLTQYATSVTLLHRSAEFRADPITIEQVLKDPKVTAIKNMELLSVEGDQFVEKLSYKIKGEETVHTIPVSGVFVEIGQLPNTELVLGLADFDEFSRIKVDPYNQRTSVSGLWAAGDCTDVRYHQNNIAVGDAIKAIEDIYLWIKRGSQ